MRPNPPRLRTRRAIHTSDRTTRIDRPIITPAKPFASAGWVTSGVKSTRIGSKSESSTRPLERYVVISRVPASGCSVQNVPEWPIAGMTISLPLGREGRSSFVAFCGGVAKSSSPPTSSVSTFDVRTRSYSRVAGPGQASTSCPPNQLKSVPGLPRIVPRSPDAKSRCAASTSLEAMAAISPQTNDSGNASWASSDWNQKPLASPSSAAIQESIVMGAESGPSAASSVVSKSP